MSLSEAARAAIGEAARREYARNPPPPASPELVARVAAILASATAPDMEAAGPPEPAAAAADIAIATNKRMSRHEDNTAA